MTKTDSLVELLRDGCVRTGRTLVLLIDHGQEPVTNTIPLVRTLRRSGVPNGEYSYYCELACSRLWFHSDRARQTILPLVQALPHCTVLHFTKMHKFHVCFDDARFGEYYVMADAGSIFFPHDFYHPLANIYLGLFGGSQLSRISNPVHRGNHGYLPHNPSEKGFLVLADDAVKPNRESMELIDFAPTMLGYLGAPIPAHMIGRRVLA